MADVKSSAFLLTSATVMIGAYGVDDVFGLTPALHSVGMVKNVKISMSSSEIELLNGIQQNRVDSQKSGVKLGVMFEGYEFSAKNMRYALGISGTSIQYKRGALTGAVAAAATTISFTSAPVLGEAASGMTLITEVPSGSTLLIQSAANPDLVFPVKTTAAATLTTGTFSVAITAVPAGMSFGIGDTIWVANTLSLGDTAPLDYFNMKVAGVLSSNNKPVVAIFPKIKIVKGFDLNMSETAYGNMPFEISPYFLTSAEVSGRLSEIGTSAQGKLYTAG